MGAFKFDYLLLAGISLVKCITMMWRNKVILLAGGEEGRDVALADVGDRRELRDVEARLFLDSGGNERHRRADHESRYFAAVVGKLVTESSQIREWGVKKQATN